MNKVTNIERKFNKTDLVFYGCKIMIVALALLIVALLDSSIVNILLSNTLYEILDTLKLCIVGTTVLSCIAYHTYKMCQTYIGIGYYSIMKDDWRRK